MTRTLVIMRHAKAEQFGPSDHERPLALRGRNDAAAAGRWLRGEEIDPDVVLVSSALRTRETFAATAGAAGWSITPSVDPTLYDAGPETVLNLLRSIPEETRTVVVVGHNPTMALTAQLLDDGTGATLGDFATSAVAVFDVAGDWADLDVGGTTASAFSIPRG